jgi:hypothetical protein
MKRTKDEVIDARGFLKGVAIHWGNDFADELNLLGAALDEVEIIKPCSISTTDPIVEQVKELFDQRSQVGIKKYGTTLHDNNTDDFYSHLQTELMDAILYLQKLKNK